MNINHGSFFTGIGITDMIAACLGWSNVFQVEKDWFCQAVLEKRFPKAHKYQSVEEFNEKYAQKYAGAIDVFSGGDPCQPSSTNGKRRGKKDVRYLWPEMFQCAKIIRPRVIFNENVQGTISNGILDTKIRDLESIGYTCWPPLLIPAGAFGALHRRNRIFLVAYANEWGSCEFNASRLSKNEKEGSERNAPLLSLTGWNESGNTSLREILRVADGTTEGLPARYRNAAIKAAGNAIHPQAILPIFQEIDIFLRDIHF